MNDQLLIASEVEQCLDFMSDRLHHGKVQETCETLDGMECPKDCVKNFHIGRVTFKRKHLAFDVREMFPRFNHEVADEFGVLAQRNARDLLRRRFPTGLVGVLQLADADREQMIETALQILLQLDDQVINDLNARTGILHPRLVAEATQRDDRLGPSAIDHDASRELVDPRPPDCDPFGCAHQFHLPIRPLNYVELFFIVAVESGFGRALLMPEATSR